MSKPEPHYIDISQLKVGLYVHLDLGWMDHPFTFSSFRIKDEAQIATIRQLGLKKLRYDPLRSDGAPLPAAPAVARTPASAVGPAVSPGQDTEAAAALAQEQEPPPTQLQEVPPTQEQESPPGAEAVKRVERLVQLQRAVDECEKKFISAAKTVRQVERILRSQPSDAVGGAQAMVDDIVDSVLSQSDIVIHALNGKRTSDDQYLHPLNVSVLALMLAKTLDMSAEDARQLGLAALFHDAGKDQVPNKILMQTDPLNRAELAFLQQHCEFGARLARDSGMAERVADIIYQHHECADGSGYPQHLQRDGIDPLARLLAVVNVYDNLCNPPNHAEARTPYEALAYMFAQQRSKFDATLLNLLIKSLGVYPPGSLVLLSDGSYGIVVSVNPSKPLRPYVMTYDNGPDTEAPLILDLSERLTLSISECLRRSQLPDKVLQRLNPRKRICYFLDKDHMALK